jgi:hypothetical protein
VEILNSSCFFILFSFMFGNFELVEEGGLVGM